jgi:hypothetical protein
MISIFIWRKTFLVYNYMALPSFENRKKLEVSELLIKRSAKCFTCLSLALFQGWVHYPGALPGHC